MAASSRWNTEAMRSSRDWRWPMLCRGHAQQPRLALADALREPPAVVVETGIGQVLHHRVGAVEPLLHRGQFRLRGAQAEFRTGRDRLGKLFFQFAQPRQ
ncbi:MAG: hypothetical protein B7Z35_08605 [Hydrogenophilales bacterium 12-61-10]|nr:MAG: hypothetical protein B7Z35_08605 [Hydrogenophilales bacterium 12-61-10]